MNSIANKTVGIYNKLLNTILYIIKLYLNYICFILFN